MSSTSRFRFRRLIDTLRAKRKRQKSLTLDEEEELGNKSKSGSVSKEIVQKNEKESAEGNGKEVKNTFFSKCSKKYHTITLDPQGAIYSVWMAITAFSTFYNLWAVTLRVIFPFQTPNNRVIWMCIDYFFDIIYIIDMTLIQTRIKLVKDGFIIVDYERTKLSYRRSVEYKLDLISIVPLDLLYIYFGPDKVILRFTRFFKVHALFAFFDLIDKSTSSPFLIRIARILMYMMYLVHVNACAYYAYSSWEGIGTNEFVYTPGIGHPYLVCFYFATKTATGIGKTPNPTQIPQILFMTFSWLMGVFVFAVLIGQTRDIISTANKSQDEYRKLVDDTIEYLRSMNQPKEVIRSVYSWFTYTWEAQHTLDENTTLDVLPPKTKTDIAMKVHIKTLTKVSLFADCDEALLRELVLQLKSVIYLPGEKVCRKGDVGKEMYILQSGKIQVMGPENEVLATLSEGCVFGEISLLGIPGMSRRTADVCSYGFSNLFVLSKNDLNSALKFYPDAQELLNKKAQELIKLNEEIERRNKLKAELAEKADRSSKSITPTGSTSTVSKSKQRLTISKKGLSRYSLPAPESTNVTTFQTKATVHRSFS